MTTVPFGDPVAITRQSLGLFAATMNRQTKLNKMVGKFPTQQDAESKLRQQTSADYPLVRCKDLTRMKGQEVTYDFISPVNGLPFIGSEYAEGRGYSMKLTNDSAKIDQVRFPINAGDTMSQQRTVHQLRSLARSQGLGWMTRYCDAAPMFHAAGSRGFYTDAEDVIPLASHPKFAKIMINTIKAPTNNRHYLAAGNYVEKFNASGNAVGIATTDTMNYSLVDHMAAILQESAFPISPCRFEGDAMKDDEPLRVWFVSPMQFKAFKESGSFRTFQSNALTRATSAKTSDLFRGNVGIWENFLIVKMGKPIRFFAGDPINWCASATSETETTTDLVPAGFGTTHAVDRSIIMGAQAIIEVMGKPKPGVGAGEPVFVSEKLLDHNDKEEVLVGIINGFTKPRFDVDFGEAGVQPTDHGVVIVDTAVKL